jgi:predicted MPP superfamily phosphohydrolase
MDFLRRHLLELLLTPFVIWIQWNLASRVTSLVDARHRPLIRWLAVAATVLVAAGFVLGFPGVSQRLHFSPALEWFKAASLAWSICSLGAWAIDRLFWAFKKLTPPQNPARRRLLQAAQAATMSIPAVMIGYGAFIERHRFRLVESRIEIPGLHKDLDGLRLVQLSDIHFGPFFGPRDLRYAIDMANSTKPHVTLVTGDLITIYRDPLDECIQLLRNLKSDAGIVGCLGNHEIVAQCQNYAERRGRAAGIRFLRSRAETLRFGEAELNLAGVDYQLMGKPYLRDAPPLLRKDRLNILLSHNPDVFPVAARQGWDLTLAGHTHGGQITVEILGMNANIARFYTPYVYGHYQKEGRQIYVSRGLGTVGLPSRFGAPPEVSLLTLCAT